MKTMNIGTWERTEERLNSQRKKDRKNIYNTYKNDTVEIYVRKMIKVSGIYGTENKYFQLI